jgi:uncharacterized protein YaeQ
MALKATVHKAELSVSDLDRHYYQDHSLTLARHPSETNERMMVRLLAFALNAGERLEFGKGLSNEEEPALWQKSLSGEIELWIDVGQPDERRLRKACGQSRQVKVYCYGERSSQLWWQQNEAALSRLANLSVIGLTVPDIDRLVERTMKLQCTVEGGDAWLSSESTQCEAKIESWLSHQR